MPSRLLDFMTGTKRGCPEPLRSPLPPHSAVVVTRAKKRSPPVPSDHAVAPPPPPPPMSPPPATPLPPDCDSDSTWRECHTPTPRTPYSRTPPPPPPASLPPLTPPQVKRVLEQAADTWMQVRGADMLLYDDGRRPLTTDGRLLSPCAATVDVIIVSLRRGGDPTATAAAAACRGQQCVQPPAAHRPWQRAQGQSTTPPASTTIVGLGPGPATTGPCPCGAGPGGGPGGTRGGGRPGFRGVRRSGRLGSAYRRRRRHWRPPTTCPRPRPCPLAATGDPRGPPVLPSHHTCKCTGRSLEASSGTGAAVRGGGGGLVVHRPGDGHEGAV